MCHTLHSSSPLPTLTSHPPNVCADVIRTIRDPEHPHSLEELAVVDEQWVTVSSDDGTTDREAAHTLTVIRIGFQPTVKHCTLATTIGLCMRVKLEVSEREHDRVCVRVQAELHHECDEH